MSTNTLNAYIFYGKNTKGLSPRFCIGLNPPPNEVSTLTERFLSQRFLLPDKEPNCWYDINNAHYRIVILTGCNSETPIEDTNTQIQAQLATIQMVSGYEVIATNVGESE